MKSASGWLDSAVDVDPSSLSKRWLILPASLIALASAALLWIDTTPDDYVQLAVEQRSLGNLTEAQQHLDNALREDPEHGPAHLESTRVSLAMDDLDAALDSAGSAIGYLEGSEQEEASRLFAQIRCKKGGPWIDADVCAKYQE